MIKKSVYISGQVHRNTYKVCSQSLRRRINQKDLVQFRSVNICKFEITKVSIIYLLGLNTPDRSIRHKNLPVCGVLAKFMIRGAWWWRSKALEFMCRMKFLMIWKTDWTTLGGRINQRAPVGNGVRKLIICNPSFPIGVITMIGANRKTGWIVLPSFAAISMG